MADKTYPQEFLQGLINQGCEALAETLTRCKAPTEAADLLQDVLILAAALAGKADNATVGEAILSLACNVQALK